jgi:hypothetical protein
VQKVILKVAKLVLAWRSVLVIYGPGGAIDLVVSDSGGTTDHLRKSLCVACVGLGECHVNTFGDFAVSPVNWVVGTPECNEV